MTLKTSNRDIQSLFLAKRKELWLFANDRFRMRNGLARNCGYVLMADLGRVVDYHVLSSYTDWQRAKTQTMDSGR